MDDHTKRAEPAARAAEQQLFWGEAPSLTVQTVAGQTSVRLGTLTLLTFAEGDMGARNVAIATLAESGSFKGREVARAFGISDSRVTQLRRRYRDGGAELLLRRTGKARGPRHLTPDQIAAIRRLRREGMSVRKIVAEMRRKGCKTSRASVGRIVRGMDVKPAQQEVALPGLDDESDAPESATPAAAAPATVEEEATVGREVEEVQEASTDEDVEDPEGWRSCAVAGAMVAHAAFDVLGVRAALAASGARFKPARTFDLTRTAFVILFGVLLRFRSIESLGHLVRGDFGALLGIDRAPEVRTIRRKLAEIRAEETGFDGAAFIRSLATSLLREAAAPEGIYFFDDHFAPYHGKRPFAKGWDAKRRLGAPGREDVYVHDLKGRALLFVPLEAPTSLSQAMPHALAELRAIDAVPRMAVFDRGGWSRELFRALLQPSDGAARIDFLTYLTARNKQRELPLEAFRVEYVTEAGKRHRYRVAERELKLKGLKTPLRVIISYDGKRKKQIPIITSDPTLRASRAVHLLRKRWRQENSFKYLVGELAIDAMISRDVITQRDHRLTPNPEHVEIKKELSEAKKALADAERDLAQALVANQEAQRPTVRGFKIANSALLRRRDEAAARVDAIEEDLAGTPAKVRRSSLDKNARIAREKTDCRLFVNGLKLAVHNAEKWLAERMGPGPYGRFALPILRALFQQSGRIRLDADRVVVEIQPLDTPRYQRCVEQLLVKLNERRTTFLDSGLPIEFRVGPPPAQAPCQDL